MGGPLKKIPFFAASLIKARKDDIPGARNTEVVVTQETVVSKNNENFI